MTSIYLISLFSSFFPIFFYILFLRWLDRYEREPYRQIFTIFILGATFSIFFALIFNTASAALSSLFFTKAGSTYILAGIVAPLVEETSKGLMVILFASFSTEFDNVTDGLIYGAIVGLGFAMTENVFYFASVYKEAGQFAWIENIYLRGFFTAGVHACSAGIFGATIGYTRHARWSERVTLALMGWGLAMMVHSFWNSVLTVSQITNDVLLGYLPYLCLPVLFMLLFIFFQFALARESHLIEVELSQEVASGLIPKNHIAYLKSYLGRGQTGWLDQKIPQDDYVKLATELAFRKNQYWRAPESKKIFYEREIKNLRQRVQEILGK